MLDEAALRRSPGSRTVMRTQLEHLLRLTDLPNVTLQIVPFHAGPHAAAGGPFTILRFPEPDLPDVIYFEQLNSALYRSDLAPLHLPRHGVQVAGRELLPVDILPARDGHRDLLKLQRGIAPRANAYAVNRDAS